MANQQQISVESVATQVARNANAQEAWWSKEVEYLENDLNLFKALVGPGSDYRPGILKRDFTKIAGQEIKETTVDALGYRPLVGGGKVEGTEEQFKDRSYSVYIDLIRERVSIAYKNAKFTIAGKDLVGGANALGGVVRERVAEKAARRDSHWILHTVKTSATANAQTTVRPDGKAQSELTSGDTLSTALLELGKLRLQGLGARPARTHMDKNGNMVPEFLALSTNSGLHALKQSPSYRQGLQEAGVRGDANPLFAGGYSRWDGLGILGFEPVTVKGAAPIGAPNLPLAHLGVAITAGTSATPVYGGGADYSAGNEQDWMESFPEYKLITREGVTPTVPGATNYAAIYDPADGKFFVFSYVLNTGYSLTMVERLGATVSGDQVTSLAGINWAGGTKVKNTAPVGGIIVPITSTGIRFGGTYIMGAHAFIWGQGDDMKRIMPYKDNGGIDVAFQMLDTQGIASCVYTSNEIARNAVYLEHAINDGGLPVDFKTYNGQ